VFGSCINVFSKLIFLGVLVEILVHDFSVQEPPPPPSQSAVAATAGPRCYIVLLRLAHMSSKV